MALLGWVMMGLAIWHYTIFMPDRFWGGIVGAFVGSLFGGDHRRLHHQRQFTIPGEKGTDIKVVLYAAPGAVIGIMAVYLEGMRRERAGEQPAPIHF